MSEKLLSNSLIIGYMALLLVCCSHAPLKDQEMLQKKKKKVMAG